jgi:hypothetical protein
VEGAAARNVNVVCGLPPKSKDGRRWLALLANLWMIPRKSFGIPGAMQAKLADFRRRWASFPVFLGRARVVRFAGQCRNGHGRRKIKTLLFALALKIGKDEHGNAAPNLLIP